LTVDEDEVVVRLSGPETLLADWERVDRVADRKGHDQRYSVDWSKIHDELGYTPKHDFTSGLADTVAWYRDNRAWWEPLKERAALESRKEQGKH
ncbi:hypothetical protein ABZ372_53810, partial [Streptomyces sp. NPDC005921]